MAVIVVTGASGGVGRAVARRYGARGDKVALLARGADGLAGAAGGVEAARGNAPPLEGGRAAPQGGAGAGRPAPKPAAPHAPGVNNPVSPALSPLSDTTPRGV